MARMNKESVQLEDVFFSTPELKVLQFLVSESTTAFSPRSLLTKIKGVRGLGGVEGLELILIRLESAGLIEYINNRKEFRLREDHYLCSKLKVFVTLCELERLRELLIPMSSAGILIGARAAGVNGSDTEYELGVLSEQSGEVSRVAAGYPLGKKLIVTTWTVAEYEELEETDPKMMAKLGRGLPLWGTRW